jgi:hypothetical protein
MDFTQLDYKGQIFAREFSLPNKMRFNFETNDTPCLTYIDDGSQKITSSVDQVTVDSHHTVLAKCGKYVTRTKGGEEFKKLKGIVFHLKPDITKEAFKGMNTDFLHAGLSKGLQSLL